MDNGLFSLRVPHTHGVSLWFKFDLDFSNNTVKVNPRLWESWCWMDILFNFKNLVFQGDDTH